MCMLCVCVAYLSVRVCLCECVFLVASDLFLLITIILLFFIHEDYLRVTSPNLSGISHSIG